MEQNSGVEPNAIIMGKGALNNCKYTNTDLKARLQYVLRATPGAIHQHLADLFELKYILVGGAVYNSGNEEDADVTASRIWSDDYALICRIAETDDPEEACVARILYWEAMGSGTDASVGYYTESQTKSTVVQVDQYLDEIVLDSKMGFLLKIDA